MKRIRKPLAVTAVTLLLATVLFLIVPLPLSWWLPRADAENMVWCCAVKVNEDRPITELDETDAKEFAEVLQQTNVRFRGWLDGQVTLPYVQVFLCDAESNMRIGDVKTLSFDEQEMLIIDGMRFCLDEEQKMVVCEAFGQIVDVALAQKFQNT